MSQRVKSRSTASSSHPPAAREAARTEARAPDPHATPRRVTPVTVPTTTTTRTRELVSGLAWAGRYVLDARVGRGGMSDVWSARDEKLGRRVALKIVSFDVADPATARERFQREVTLSRQLVGAGFVEVLGSGEVGDGAYLAMELLQGETLHARLRARRQLSPGEVLELLLGLAEPVRVLHALQIVHRDLKPGNVFLARPTPASSGVQALGASAKERVKLIDLGIARDAWDDARLTRPGICIGSAHYMSPEQIRSGRDVDARSDLFSVGVLLYQALAGRRPFEGDAAEVFAKILSSAHVPPTEFVPSLPAGFDAFFEQALAKAPAERFASIDELCEGFRAALATSPQRALPRPSERPTLEQPAPRAPAPSLIDPGVLPSRWLTRPPPSVRPAEPRGARRVALPLVLAVATAGALAASPDARELVADALETAARGLRAR